MINNLEGKNKAELIEIINIQIEEYQKLASENAKLQQERDKAIKSMQFAISSEARASLLNQIIMTMIDPGVEDEDRVCGSDWDYISDEQYQNVKRLLNNRDLEQQAKGLSDYSESIIRDAKEIPIGLEHKGRGSNIYNWETHFARELRFRSNKLLNQAKGES